MTILKRADWSKSYIHVPRDNIQNSNVLAKSKQFVASFAHDLSPPPMNLLIGWEYGRNWLIERDTFAAKRSIMNKPKIIHNDFKKWIEKRKVRNVVTRINA